MLTKKYSLVILVLIMSSAAFGQLPAHPNIVHTTTPKNYSSFTFFNKNIPPLLRQLTPLKYQNNPDFGYLPYTAPTAFLELVQKRTLNSRYYVKYTQGQTDTTFAIEQSIDQINYYDSTSHFIRAIDPRLQPVSYSQKIFSAPHQLCPTKIDIGDGFISITNGSNELQFAKKLHLLHKDILGNVTDLGAANWSNYTVGDNGAMIYNAWPHIDIKIDARQGSFETSFIINSNLSLNNGWLIVRDSMNVPSDLAPGMGNGAMNSNNQWVGDIYYSQGDSTKFALKQGNINDNAQNDTTLGYIINNNFLDMYAPISFLNDTSTHYPVTIDPTVTGVVAQATLNTNGSDETSNSGYGCSYPFTVAAPPFCTITDIEFSPNFTAQNGAYVCYGSNAYAVGGLALGAGLTCIATAGCSSPFHTYGTVCDWSPTYTSGLFHFYSSCVPTPACAVNLNFTFYFYAGFSSGGHPAGTCSTYYIYADQNWSVLVTGTTVAQPAPPTSSAGATLCHSTATTLTATGTYGVPGYTYSWSPSTGLSSTTTNPTTANISATTTYTITITDACGQTATQTITLTYNACLPIQLLNFNAQYNAAANITNLNWATASESNNNYFTVERTLDGVNYITIDSVKGANNSTQTLNYSAIDAHPVNGVDYYRLKQTDFDGNYTYSDVVAVAVDVSGKAKLSVIPNPAGNEATVSFVSPIIGTALLNIYDYTGRLVKTEQIATNIGNNTLPLDVSTYNNGVYFVSVNNSIQLYSAKLVVNH